MRKMSGKVGAFLISAAMAAIVPSAAEACFSCYCNGDYVGCVTTIQYCRNACQPQETLASSSAKALDPRVRSKVSCTEATRDDQSIFSCVSKPTTK